MESAEYDKNSIGDSNYHDYGYDRLYIKIKTKKGNMLRVKILQNLMVFHVQH